MEKQTIEDGPYKQAWWRVTDSPVQFTDQEFDVV